MNNTEVYKQTIKMTSAITPAQGVTTSNYVNYFISPVPGTGNGNVSVALQFSPEFGLYKTMYDQFRVHSVTMKIIPRSSNTEAIQLILNNDNSTISAGKLVYYSVEDRDNNAPGNINAMKKYSSVKTHRMDRSVSRTYRVKYDGPNSWFDCQNVNSLADVQKSIGLWGGITVYGESFPERYLQVLNSVWADLEVTYQVSFRGKALVDLQYDPDSGEVTLTPLSVDTEAPQVFSSADEIPNFGSVDTSGNQIGTFTIPEV